MLLDNNGRRLEGEAEGNLVSVDEKSVGTDLVLQCFEAAWPGMSRTCLNDHDRFTKTYFAAFPGFYFTGDGARRDVDGYFHVTGRVDG